MRFRPNGKKLTRRTIRILTATLAGSVVILGGVGLSAPAIAAGFGAPATYISAIVPMSATATVPTLVGWTASDAVKTLKSRGFGYKITAPKGQKAVTLANWTVTKQNPKAKSKAKVGSKITLTVVKNDVYAAQQIRKFYSADYGTFAAISGSGPTATTFTLPSGIRAALITARHTGSGRFTIEELGAKGVDTKRASVDVKGNYSGTVAIGLVSVTTPTTAVRVTGNGKWSIVIAPISTAPIVALPAKGAGNRVYLYSGLAAIWNVASPGATRFSLNQISSSSYPNLAVNETGNWSGPVSLQPGPSVVEIESTGTWTIK